MSDWGLGFRVSTPGVDAHPKALTRLDDQRLIYIYIHILGFPNIYWG